MTDKKQAGLFNRVARILLGLFILGGIMNTYNGIQTGHVDVLLLGLAGIIIPFGYLAYKGYRDSDPTMPT